MRYAAVVFLISLAILSIGAANSGLAAAFLDPVSRIQVQDEATYAHSSLRMAHQGGWLTPHFLGRYALYKPPLLYWLSGAAVTVLGPSNFAIRFPAMLAGALTVTLVFLWIRKTSPGSAIFGAALLLTSHLFFVLDRVALTDPLLCALTTVAIYLLHRDPLLDRRHTRLGFAAAVALAILAKSVAGLIAPIALVILFLRTLRAAPIPVARILQTGACTVGLAAPWFLYQWLVHPHWFVNEFILTETLAWGLYAPAQTSSENGLLFYASRLFKTDPVLLLAAAVALLTAPRRTPGLILIEAWAAAVVVALTAFGYRSASYLLPLLPALAILAAGAIRGPALSVALALVIGAKFFAPHATWGLPIGPETTSNSAAQIEAYAKKRLNRELVIIEPDDQFVSATLVKDCGGSIPRVRYVYIDNPTTRMSLPLDFAKLGVSITARDFLALDATLPRFKRELRAMDLGALAPNGEPVASVIHAANEAEVNELIRTYPEFDFYWPARAKWFTGPEPPPKP